MQAVKSSFTDQTNRDVRRIKTQALMTFTKTPSGATQYFTVGESEVGVSDPIAPSTSTDINEWDKYIYEEYAKDRLIDLEITHEQDLLGGLIMGMADATFNNTDDLFTPHVDDTIGEFVQSPKRPIRLYTGFGNDLIPIFTGITEKAPRLRESGKDAKFHALDFISFIADLPLDQSVMYENMRTDEIIADLLVEKAGLSINQFELEAGIITIPFAYFEKDAKLGNIIQDLCESELATFFQDEEGKLRFWNRQHLTKEPYITPQWTFNRDNCRDISYPDVNNVINVVEVFSLVRAVQANQKLWETADVIEIPAGGTAEVFADFRDDYGDLPVTTVDEPEYITSATTSLYSTNAATDGSGDTMAANVSLIDSQKFGTAYKMTFENTASVRVYITSLELFARPAKVINEIFVRRQNSASIAKYEEQVHTIKNNFIQTQAFARSLAIMLLEDRADPSQVRRLEVTKAAPQLQIGDLVTFDDGSDEGTFTLQKRELSISPKGGMTDIVHIVSRTVKAYFTAGISDIGGADGIAP